MEGVRSSFLICQKFLSKDVFCTLNCVLLLAVLLDLQVCVLSSKTEGLFFVNQEKNSFFCFIRRKRERCFYLVKITIDISCEKFVEAVVLVPGKF